MIHTNTSSLAKPSTKKRATSLPPTLNSRTSTSKLSPTPRCSLRSSTFLRKLACTGTSATVHPTRLFKRLDNAEDSRQKGIFGKGTCQRVFQRAPGQQLPEPTGFAHGAACLEPGHC